MSERATDPPGRTVYVSVSFSDAFAVMYSNKELLYEEHWFRTRRLKIMNRAQEIKEGMRVDTGVHGIGHVVAEAEVFPVQYVVRCGDGEERRFSRDNICPLDEKHDTDPPSPPREDPRLTRLGLPQLTAIDPARAEPGQIRLMALCAGRPAEHPVLASVASLRDELVDLYGSYCPDSDPSAFLSSLARLRDRAISVVPFVESYVETRDAEASAL